MTSASDREIEAYDGELADRLRAVLGDELVALYVTGSSAVGDYVPGRSDLDRLAVSRGPLDRQRKQDVVATVRHEALPCPARGLELVVYAREAVATPPPGGAFELNLNTVARMPLHASLDPAEEPSHWFVLDRALAREHARPLLGPQPRDLLARLPDRWVLHALAESLAWHAANGDRAGEHAVLNACRAWRYAAERVWSSKREAAAWAAALLEEPGVVDAALARRHGRDVALAPATVASVTTRAAQAVHAAGMRVPRDPPPPRP